MEKLVLVQTLVLVLVLNDEGYWDITGIPAGLSQQGYPSRVLEQLVVARATGIQAF